MQQGQQGLARRLDRLRQTQDCRACVEHAGQLRRRHQARDHQQARLGVPACALQQRRQGKPIGDQHLGCRQGCASAQLVDVVDGERWPDEPGRGHALVDGADGQRVDQRSDLGHGQFGVAEELASQVKVLAQAARTQAEMFPIDAVERPCAVVEDAQGPRGAAGESSDQFVAQQFGSR